QKVVNGIVQAQAWIQDNRQETARILSRDNPQKYTPHTYEALANVLEHERLDVALYERSGAMVNTAWNQKRIDFQPYPFPSYTEELVRKLKTTLVSGQNDFLKDLDPAFVARDLVDDRYVKQAILAHGGAAAFALPESFSREKTITAWAPVAPAARRRHAPEYGAPQRITFQAFDTCRTRHSAQPPACARP